VFISRIKTQRKYTAIWRQSGRPILAAGVLALAACGSSGPEQGDIGFIEGYFGGLIADEPRAALVGREVLSAGGTAADAVVAAYFAMAVTMPGSASLGGGGVCLVHDAEQVRTEAISFLPGRPAGPNARFAVPGNVRGMFLLHARYGELVWSDLLRPAEDFARSGHAVSRAFVRDYQAAQPVVAFNPEARRVFGSIAGGVDEGRLFEQLELGAVMSNLRTLGPGVFYDGSLGRSLASAVRAAGGSMTLEDLRNYRPELLQPIRFERGDNVVVFPPTLGGLISAQTWAAAIADDRFEDAAGVARRHLVLEAGARAYQSTLRGGAAPDLVSESAVSALMADYYSTAHSAPRVSVAVREDDVKSGATIVAVDNLGRTVACSFTMNGTFGAGVIAPATGILLANLPGTPRSEFPSVAMMVNENVGLTFFAAAGSGPTPVSVARIAVETITATNTLTATDGDMIGAVAAPRSYSTGNPDAAVVEAALSGAEQDELRALGHNLKLVPQIGRVNGFFCPRGLPRFQVCQFVKDPRSYGLAITSDE